MKNVLLRAGICVWLKRGLPTVGHRKMNEPFEWRFWCSFVMFCACVACVWIACVFVYIVLYMVCGVCVRITFCPLTIVCLCMRWCASMRVSHHVVAHAQTTIFAYNYTWWVQLNGSCVFPEQQTINITVENSITEIYSAELAKQKNAWNACMYCWWSHWVLLFRKYRFVAKFSYIIFVFFLNSNQSSLIGLHTVEMPHAVLANGGMSRTIVFHFIDYNNRGYLLVCGCHICFHRVHNSNIHVDLRKNIQYCI